MNELSDARLRNLGQKCQDQKGRLLRRNQYAGDLRKRASHIRGKVWVRGRWGPGEGASIRVVHISTDAQVGVAHKVLRNRAGEVHGGDP